MRCDLSLPFAICWLSIILISVIDGYLVFQCREVIGLTEQNPVGIALLSLNGGNTFLLLLAKFLGTVFACAWLQVLFRKNASTGMIIATALTVFQVGLLIYLYFA